VPARAGGELANRRGGPADHAGDLVERQAEHVVQHERGPLRRRQRFQDDEQGHAHRFVERDPSCTQSSASATVLPPAQFFRYLAAQRPRAAHYRYFHVPQTTRAAQM
jgi:hypothetical protein